MHDIDEASDNYEESFQECTDDTYELKHTIHRIEKRIKERITNLTIDFSILRFHGKELNEDGHFQEIDTKIEKERTSTSEDENSTTESNNLYCERSSMDRPDSGESIKNTLFKIRRIENSINEGCLINISEGIVDDNQSITEVEHTFTDSSSVEDYDSNHDSSTEEYSENNDGNESDFDDGENPSGQEASEDTDHEPEQESESEAESISETGVGIFTKNDPEYYIDRIFQNEYRSDKSINLLKKNNLSCLEGNRLLILEVEEIEDESSSSSDEEEDKSKIRESGSNHEIPEKLSNRRRKKQDKKKVESCESDNDEPIEEDLHEFLKNQDQSLDQLEGKMLQFGKRKIIIMGYPLPDEMKGSKSDDDDDDDYECLYRRS